MSRGRVGLSCIAQYRLAEKIPDINKEPMDGVAQLAGQLYRQDDL